MYVFEEVMKMHFHIKLVYLKNVLLDLLEYLIQSVWVHLIEETRKAVI